MSTTTMEANQPSSSGSSSQPASESRASQAPAWNIPSVSYEDLNRLAKEKFWPAVNAFVEKYQENPSQTILIATLSLLAFIPLSAFVAILSILATVAATLLMLALQITLVCSTIVIATALSVLSLSSLFAPGIAKLTEGSVYVRDFIARAFGTTAPSQEAGSSASAVSTPSQNAPQTKTRSVGRRVLSKLLRPRVIITLMAGTLLAAPFVFLLRHLLLHILIDILRIAFILTINLLDTFLFKGLVVGYIGYRFGRPSHRRANPVPVPVKAEEPVSEPTLPPPRVSTATPPRPASQTRTTSPSPNFVDEFKGFRSDIFNFVYNIAAYVHLSIMYLLKNLPAGIAYVIETLEAIPGKMSEDVDRVLENERRQAGGFVGQETVDAKKSAGDEYEEYEMLTKASGSSSALESKGSLSERKGKAKVENEEL